MIKPGQILSRPTWHYQSTESLSAVGMYPPGR